MASYSSGATQRPSRAGGRIVVSRSGSFRFYNDLSISSGRSRELSCVVPALFGPAMTMHRGSFVRSFINQFLPSKITLTALCGIVNDALLLVNPLRPTEEKIPMRIAGCGMRNLGGHELKSRRCFIPHSAFRIPHLKRSGRFPHKPAGFFVVSIRALF